MDPDTVARIEFLREKGAAVLLPNSISYDPESGTYKTVGTVRDDVEPLKSFIEGLQQRDPLLKCLAIQAISALYELHSQYGIVFADNHIDLGVVPGGGGNYIAVCFGKTAYAFRGSPLPKLLLSPRSWPSIQDGVRDAQYAGNIQRLATELGPIGEKLNERHFTNLLHLMQTDPLSMGMPPLKMGLFFAYTDIAFADLEQTPQEAGAAVCYHHSGPLQIAAIGGDKNAAERLRLYRKEMDAMTARFEAQKNAADKALREKIQAAEAKRVADEAAARQFKLTQQTEDANDYAAEEKHLDTIANATTVAEAVGAVAILTQQLVTIETRLRQRISPNFIPALRESINDMGLLQSNSDLGIVQKEATKSWNDAKAQVNGAIQEYAIQTSRIIGAFKGLYDDLGTAGQAAKQQSYADLYKRAHDVDALVQIVQEDRSFLQIVDDHINLQNGYNNVKDELDGAIQEINQFKDYQAKEAQKNAQYSTLREAFLERIEEARDNVYTPASRNFMDHAPEFGDVLDQFEGAYKKAESATLEQLNKDMESLKGHIAQAQKDFDQQNAARVESARQKRADALTMLAVIGGQMQHDTPQEPANLSDYDEVHAYDGRMEEEFRWAEKLVSKAIRDTTKTLKDPQNVPRQFMTIDTNQEPWKSSDDIKEALQKLSETITSLEALEKQRREKQRYELAKATYIISVILDMRVTRGSDAWAFNNFANQIDAGADLLGTILGEDVFWGAEKGNIPVDQAAFVIMERAYEFLYPDSYTNVRRENMTKEEFENHLRPYTLGDVWGKDRASKGLQEEARMISKRLEYGMNFHHGMVYYSNLPSGESQYFSYNYEPVPSVQQPIDTPIPILDAADLNKLNDALKFNLGAALKEATPSAAIDAYNTKMTTVHGILKKHLSEAAMDQFMDGKSKQIRQWVTAPKALIPEKLMAKSKRTGQSTLSDPMVRIHQRVLRHYTSMIKSALTNDENAGTAAHLFDAAINSTRINKENSPAQRNAQFEQKLKSMPLNFQLGASIQQAQRALETLEYNDQFLKEDGTYDYDMLSAYIVPVLDRALYDHREAIGANADVVDALEHMQVPVYKDTEEDAEKSWDAYLDNAEKDFATQTRYMHCLSIAADILHHIEQSEAVPALLLERCVSEWPSK